MKGCVFLQGNFAKIGHALALQLRDQHGVSEFCAYTFSHRAKEFVDSQTDLRYTKILADHEVHEQYKHEVLDLDYIKKIEKKYGNPTLWNYLYPDRRLMFSMDSETIQTMELNALYPWEDILKIVQVRVRALEQFLQTEKPDFVIIFSMGLVGTMLMYHMAKQMGVSVIVMDSVRLGNLMTFTTDFNTLSGVKELFEQIHSGKRETAKHSEAKKILSDFLSTRTLRLSYTIDNHKTPPITLVSRIKSYYGIWQRYLKQDHKKHDYDKASSPWRVAWIHLLQKLRKIRGYDDLYSPTNWHEDFAFFPLQYEPEASLLNIAPFYYDQLMVIRAVAKSLPIHYKLYVKEHPAMMNRRTRLYYKQLLKIPNVCLVDHRVKSIDIIEHAKLITAITGTAGWEATLLGRPVISFGHVFYNDFPSVTRCNSLDSLPSLIHDKLQTYVYDERSVVDFIAAILENGTVDFSYYPMEYMAPEAVRRHPEIASAANLIMDKIKN